jgi:hypothetical protein
MARTKIAEYAKGAVEDDVGVPLSPAGTEAGEYERAWLPLISTMRVGVALHDALQEVIDEHKREKRSDELPAVEPLDRLAEIKVRLEALSERYSGIIGRFLVWKEQLREDLRRAQAHLAGIPVLSAVDGVAAAFSRGFNHVARVPTKPHLDLNSVASLSARAQYLTTVKELAQTAEAFPGDVGRAIQNLAEVMARHVAQLEEARFKGNLDNTSAYRVRPPKHPLCGPLAQAPKAAVPASDYEWLAR